MGRPSLYSPELAAEICQRLSDGKSLREICADEGMPDRGTVRRWLLADSEFRTQYAQAREEQAHVIAEEAVADALVAKDASLARLAFDARRWFAGKLAPKVYGEKVELEATIRKTVSSEPLSEDEWAAKYGAGVATAGGTTEGTG